MKSSHLISGLFFCLLATAVQAQGPLAPPGPPGPTQKSLQEIWDRMHNLETLVVAQQEQITLLQQQNTLLLAAANVALPWSYETVNNDQPLSGISLAFSPAGQAAIAYCEEGSGVITFARRSPAGWVGSTVDSSGGPQARPSLAFSPAGKPMIAFHRSGPNSGLSVARFNGSAWVIDTVDEGDTGYNPCLVFSPAGVPSIAYDDTEDGGIGYAQAAAGEDVWTTDTIPAPGAERPSLAFDAEGNPAIAYQVDTVSLHLVRKTAGSWITTTIAEDPEEYLEYTAVLLAFTPSGQAAVTYDSYFSEGRLTYAVFDEEEDEWQTSVVSTASDWGFSSVLTFSPSRLPVVAYTLDADLDEWPSNLAVATLKAGVWEKEYLGVTYADKYESGRYELAFTPGGQPAVVFSTGSSIRYAVKGGL